MYDDILEACARDEFRGLGLDEDDVAEALTTMRSQGLFDMPPADLVAEARRQSDEMALDDEPVREGFIPGRYPPRTWAEEAADPGVAGRRRAFRASLRGDGGS